MAELSLKVLARDIKSSRDTEQADIYSVNNNNFIIFCSSLKIKNEYKL